MTTAVTKAGAEAFNTQESFIFSWLLAAGETGDAVLLPGYADRTLHVYGTFGGATVILEGSNEPDTPAPSNYKTLNDPFNAALSKTAAALAAVVEMTRLVRPRISGGDGTTAIVIKLLAKR